MTQSPTPPDRDWNPALYMKFEAERTRAARDLLAGVPLDRASLVYDLGCGPGNSSELLAHRFPDARIVGLDTSGAMLAYARKRIPHVEFLQRDVADWTPDGRPHLIFANAVLHFLPGHDTLLPKLMSYLAEGGRLAIQMPDMTRETTHALMRMIAADGPWSDRLMPVAKSRAVIAPIESYYDWLRPLCSELTLWQTTYFHPLDGAQGVVDWFAGSGLRPFLDRLDTREREMFLDRYRRELESALPLQPDGRLLLAYPRVFMVAAARSGD